MRIYQPVKCGIMAGWLENVKVKWYIYKFLHENLPPEESITHIPITPLVFPLWGIGDRDGRITKIKE